MQTYRKIQRSQSERYRTRSVHYIPILHSITPSPEDVYGIGKEERGDEIGEKGEENFCNSSSSSSSSSPVSHPHSAGNNLSSDRYAIHSLSFHEDVFDDPLLPCHSACKFTSTAFTHHTISIYNP